MWSHPVIDVRVKISGDIHLVWVREELGLPVHFNLSQVNNDIHDITIAARTD